MQKSPQRFTLAVPLKLAYLSRWLLFNYAASTVSTPLPFPLSSPAAPVNLLIYALLTDYCAAPNCHSPEQKAGEKTAQSKYERKMIINNKQAEQEEEGEEEVVEEEVADAKEEQEEGKKVVEKAEAVAQV